MVLTLLEELSELHERQRQETLGVEAGEASQRVALADVCREALEERPPPTGAAVTLDVSDDAVAVGEPMRVVRILDNLLTNAFRYGGPQVTVSARRDGSFVRLEVHDDGPGVPLDITPRVFDAHVRGPDSERLGGSGLGLAIVRELCVSMGGSVSYEDRDGALFTVVLPAAPDTSPGDPGQADRSSEDAAWESTSQERVARRAHPVRCRSVGGLAVAAQHRPAYLRGLTYGLSRRRAAAAAGRSRSRRRTAPRPPT